MMKLLTILNFSLFLISSAYGEMKSKGTVQKVFGNVFATSNGKTRILSPGKEIYEFDELFTEVGAELTFNDFFDHVITLSGGSHVVVMNRMFELKGGYFWLKTLTPRTEQFSVQTVNAIAEFQDGSFIASFDQETGRTQVLGLEGEVLLSNIRTPEFKEAVSAGKFSFISKEFNNGNPRVATTIGRNAHQKVVALFKRSPSEEVEVAGPKRLPASESEGKIVILKRDEESLKKKDELIDFYKTKLEELKKKQIVRKKPFKIDYTHRSGVPIKIYGMPDSERAPATSKSKDKGRSPSSISGLSPTPEKKDQVFENSLLKEFKTQQRHEQEINNLIRDLKSFDMDYNQSY